MQVAAQEIVPDPSTVTMAGAPAQLGPYRLEALLGEGGMGRVFGATDTRLHRRVAIKILPHDKVADPERKRRFLLEARAASALNHPNIVTLYDIASDNGIDYLVMEYVAGKSLDKLVAPQGLPFAKIVGYASQIVNALAAAHAAGVVHRDIKPANVMVTPEGQAKVLDFGLAKLEERAPAPDSETLTMLTKPGSAMGTMPYMSPEQARAEEVDVRTDLFSFGAVLYEMATGRRAFPRLLDWTMPALDSMAAGLRPIVTKLLQTEREQRYQTAANVASDLKRLQRSSETRLGSRQWWIASAGAISVLAIAAAAVFSLKPNRPAGIGEWVRLTNFRDSVSQPALSPDGRMLAFVRGPDTFSAPGQIYVKNLPDGEPVQLTRDEFNKMSPVFSPDGSRIAYTVTHNGWNTWQIPVVSGQPRLWLTNASGLVWLDNQRLLFSEIKKEGPMGIVTSQETRAGERDVYVLGIRGMAHRTYPSPDGKSALIVEMERGRWLPCRLVPLNATSAGRPIGPGEDGCTVAAWSPDGKWMYFSSSAGGSFHSWRQRYPDGQPEQITSGLTEEEGIAMAPDGRSFITAVASTQSVVWLHDGSAERQISLEGYSYDPKFTPDGKKLVYRILKGALPAFAPSELRVVELATGHNDPLFPGLTFTARVGLAYSISPDGREVVAAAKDRNGKSRLWLAALDGQSPSHQIPNVEGDMPHFGKDGEIFFRTIEGNWAKAYAVHEDGTGLRMMSDRPVTGIYGISQDRRWLVVRFASADTPSALPVAGGSPLPAPGFGQPLSDWSPDGRWIFVSVPIGPVPSNILGKTYAVPLPSGQMFPSQPAQTSADLAKLPGVRIIDAYDMGPGPTPDTYAFSRQTVQRNLYRVPVP